MVFSNYFLAIPRKIIQKLENIHAPFINYLLTFFSILTLRNFLESFSQRSINYLNLPPTHFILDWLHYNLFYISIAISLILLFHVITRVKIETIARVMLPCFIILLLAPILDLIISLGRGYNISYIGLLPSRNPLALFLSYFGNTTGITIGMKIEIILVLYATSCYFILKGRSIFSSLLHAFLIYTLFFFYAVSPILLHLLLINLGYDFQFSSLLMCRFYLLLIFITGIGLAYFSNQRIFYAIMKDLRWLRLGHYFLMLALGTTLALINKQPIAFFITQKNPELVINLILTTISIVFAALFSIIMNNIADQEIDRISNSSRPLITGIISLKTYKYIATMALITALFYAAMAGVKAFFIIAVTITGYYIYSMPPVRFKRVILFSKLVISINSLALILLGYLLVQDNLYGFPNTLFTIFLIGFTVAINFIDIKDKAGDAHAKIKTLPVVLGLKNSKIMIGIAFLLTYISFYFLIHKPIIFLLLFLGGCVQIYLLNRKPYQENLVFIFYLISMIFLIGLLWVRV